MIGCDGRLVMVGRDWCISILAVSVLGFFYQVVRCLAGLQLLCFLVVGIYASGTSI